MAATSSRFLKTKEHGRCAWRVVYALFFAASWLAACAPSASSGDPIFIAPTAPANPTFAVTVVSLWTATATESADSQPVSTPEMIFTPVAQATEPPPPENCVNALKFLSDLTVPDGSPVSPGQKIDKQWLAQNSGTCNWGEGYRLKLVAGFPPFGAEVNQALFPARAGAEVTLQIFFVAPPVSGIYRSAWQAYDPNDLPFGETIYIEFMVPE